MTNRQDNATNRDQQREATAAACNAPAKRPALLELIGLFAFAFLIYKLLSKIGIFSSAKSIGEGLTAGAAFMLGLVAASSSCVAVTGGLLLGSAKAFRNRYGGETPERRMRPVVMFVTGRTISYALLGGAIGLLGSSLTPSPLATGAITVIAAGVMLAMGLDMLGVAPLWMKRLIPQPPKSIARGVVKQETSTAGYAPLLLGAGTFFLPCGFTQTLQLYALSSSDPLLGAKILGAFALGTAPALLALGWAAGSVRGKTGAFFLRLSGAFVVLIGLSNITNGFAIAGYSLPKTAELFRSERAARAETNQNLAPMYGGIQRINMTAGYSGYQPNVFTIRAGVQTVWNITAEQNGGCLSVLQVPGLGIQSVLQKGTNTIAFIPQKPGVIPFSCSMGMFRGEIHIVPNA